MNMTVKEAREMARRWMVQEGCRAPGFCGAYIAGSTNWLPDDADLIPASDLDVMVVTSDQNQAGSRVKFVYNNTLLEVSYLQSNRLQSPDQVLSDYHLAPSFRTTKGIFDPFGYLTPLLAAVSRHYSARAWVRRRCMNARDKILAHLRSIKEEAALHDQVMACLFAAGITTHVLLVAGLRNPTVRGRYVAVRELLSKYRRVEFHETLLELLGSVRMSGERVREHLCTLTEVFDVAKEAIRTPFPFATDISDTARPAAIDASFDLIERGYHREAMFWLAVSHSRCHKVLSRDAPEGLPNIFKKSFQQLAGDIGMSSFPEIRQRCAQIERMVPLLYDVAEGIIEANWEIEGD